MNDWNCNDFGCVQKVTESQLYTVHTNPAVEQNKNVKWQRVRRISLVGKEMVYGGKDVTKSQVLSSKWKNERVREDESGNS